jgi:tetratricopeptide (TPR) repeat protein
MAIINHPSKEFSTRHRNILVCLFIVIATISVYWPVQSYDFVNFDDGTYVYENGHVQKGLTLEGISWAFTTLHAGNWHPLTWLSHMLDCQLYGMNPGRHHLTNLLLHLANTVLLFFVFRKMTGSLWQSGLVAALFAIHPLHVESVAWISERKDVLSAFFWMLTLWSYIWYVEHPKVNRYLLVILFFALGLMSKPMLVTLPFVLLLLDFYLLRRFKFQPPDVSAKANQKSNNFRLILEKIPLFVLVAVSSAVTFFAQKKGGAVMSLEILPFNVRIANALVSYVKYLGKMVYPSKLAVLYPHPGMLPWWKIAGACLILASISFLAVRVVKQSPYFAVGWLWYVGTLVPVIGLVQVGGQAMADRYTYIPLIGIFIIIAFGVPELVAQWRFRKIWLTASAAAFLTILVAITWKQIGYWKNGITLFTHALKVTSNNYVSHNNLGNALAKQGRPEEAIEQYLLALQIKPYYAEAYNNLGNALEKQGLLAKAGEKYLHALRVKPDYAEAHNNLGNVLDKQGRTAEAIEHYLQALKIKPDFVKAHNNLGNALHKQGRIEEAMEHYLQALQIKPDFAGVHYNMGNALAENNRPEEAIAHYTKALEISPEFTDAHINIGIALEKQGKTAEAIEHYQKVLVIEPRSPMGLEKLARSFKRMKKYQKALFFYNEILKVLPGNPAVYYNIACVYALQNQVEDAIWWLKKAVAKGFDDWNHIKTDIDLVYIRGSSQYKEFVKGH